MSNKSLHTYEYGTAGFRMEASLLKPIAVRIGLLASYLSALEHGKWIGVMITASHNPIQDNGVKIVAPDGGIPSLEWEGLAVKVANCSAAELPNLLPLGRSKGRVILGRDTRPSGIELSELVQQGALLHDSQVLDVGLCTTPQLHYLTLQLNTSEPLELGSLYQSWLIEAFEPFKTMSADFPPIVVDCANGVGYSTARSFLPQLLPDVNFINTGDGILNEDCGADYVKTNKRCPLNALEDGKLHASLDGDADRLVMYYVDKNASFCLLDGDRMATLMALYFQQEKRRRSLQLSIGVVQTAYANGASTEYIEKRLGVPVTFTSTGVKHLHRAAIAFDIGIYFEANGHGTVLFSNEAKAAFPEISHLVNQCVGDALSDLLLVIVVLRQLNMSPQEWHMLYSDKPSCLLKVPVKERNIFKVTDADRKLEAPEGLQSQIDALIGPQCRAFLRPSGTENVVRVFAEANTQIEADRLGAEIAQLVR